MPIKATVWTTEELRQLLGGCTKQYVSKVARERGWQQVSGYAGEIEEFLNERGIEMSSAKDWVICPDCGEEYNRVGPGHECDPRVLVQIKADRKADEEVRESESDHKI